MIITIDYDEITNTYYLRIVKNGVTTHNGFDTEKEAISYLIDYCEELHTHLLRA